jgi:4-oxalomesaconate tautomerase
VRPEGHDRLIVIEHPSGVLEVTLETRDTDNGIDIVKGGLLRTARKLMAGEVYVQAAVLQAEAGSDTELKGAA